MTAIAELEKRAADGDLWARFELKKRQHLNFHGKEMNYDKANEWFLKEVPTLKKSAEKGDVVAISQLALAYIFGWGGRTIEKEEKEWIKKGIPILEEQAENGDVGAMDALAWAYGIGLGVEVNPAKAQEWYKRLDALTEKAED